MAEKYNLKPVSLNQNNVIRAKKTKMWEILCDSTSRGLRGGGRFPEEFAREFDKDIDDLQEIIKRI